MNIFSLSLISKNIGGKIRIYTFSLTVLKEPDSMARRNVNVDKNCGYPQNPCITPNSCWIPFIVPPPVNKSPFCKIAFGRDACDRDCECNKGTQCDLAFLCEDQDTGCPDLHRTCTRSECCQVAGASPAPVPVPSPQATPQKNIQSAEDFKRVRQTREKLPSALPSDDKKRSASGEPATLTITLVDKNQSPHSARISPEGSKVWAINGHAGARINLQRGQTCKFDVRQENPDGANAHGFFFSRDIMGPGKEFGTRDATPLDGTKIVKNGILTLKVDNETPATFYYHSTAGAFRGGEIQIYERND